MPTTSRHPPRSRLSQWPVCVECLDYALLDDATLAGVWGGLTRPEAGLCSEGRYVGVGCDRGLEVGEYTAVA